MEKPKTEELLLEARNFFNSIKKEVGKDIRTGKNVIYVDFNELISLAPTLSKFLLSSPEEIFQVLEVALEESGLLQNPRVRLKGLPENFNEQIRNLRAKHLNHLIQIEGLVRQASEVRPQVVNAKFECPNCGTVISVLQIESKFREPTRCSCGRKGGFKLINKIMVDVQRIVIEESPESLIGGEQPRRINVFLKEDLVEPKMEEKTTPGARVRILGILKEMVKYTQSGGISTKFDIFLEANHITPLEETFEELKISEEDERQIQELAADPNVFQKLADSIASSVYGYDEIKQSLVLQLFGGVKKTRSDGKTHTRGDIHLLLVGDPGCLVGDERVILGNGSIIKIKELGKEHLQKINTRVLTGEGGKKRDAAEVFHYYKQQPIIEIITETGKSIKGTYNHPLLNITNKNGKLFKEWKRLDEFKIGDKVAVVIGFPCTITKYLQTNFKPLNRKLGQKFRGKLPRELNPELASFLGYLLGDGWILKSKIGFVVAESEKDITDKLIKICENSFGIKPKQKKRIAKGRKVQPYYYTINSVDIANSLKFMKEKRVPDLILKSGNKVASSFLRWLYEADGAVFNKGRGRRAIALKAKNIELLRDVQILLLRLGIHSRIIENALVIRRGRDIIKFANRIGFASNKKRSIMKKLASEAESFKSFSSQRSERIVKIIRHNKLEEVFDIEIPKSHRFIANGIVSHNTAKSVVLRLIAGISPKGRYVAGRGTTGAGLTATVVRDEFLRGWSLEAGAMVLANKGIIAIDEIEKMDPQDRSAMHEALEQQSVTISKANVQAMLRAETSVLAAGNPKFGRFDPHQTVASQIDIPPTLINRFDVVFVMKDIPDRAKDEAIATHVLLEHKQQGEKSIIDRELLRRYIAYAKQKINPQLTDAAVDEIKKFYVDLRNMQISPDLPQKPLPISARQLEALVRMAEASAKSRLSQKVTKEDAKRAIALMRFYLTQVGYDYETKTFDIDRIATGVSTSQRSKIMLVKETLARLESRLGKLIPIEEVIKELENKISDKEVEDALDKLTIAGDIFHPRKGFVQRM